MDFEVFKERRMLHAPDAMANPIFLLFATRAGFAATVLRLTIAAFLLYHAVGEIRFLLNTGGSGEPSMVYSWMRVGSEPGWWGVIANGVFGLGILFGFFTRFFGFTLLTFLLVGLFSPVFAENDWIREAVLFASLSLAMTIAGGGTWSIDKKVSEYLLPTIG